MTKKSGEKLKYLENEKICQVCQVLVVDICHFQFSLIHPLKKTKHWKLDIIDYRVIGAGY